MTTTSPPNGDLAMATEPEPPAANEMALNGVVRNGEVDGLNAKVNGTATDEEGNNKAEADEKKEEDEAAAVKEAEADDDEGGEQPPPKTPVMGEASVPTSATTRASTRKRRSAAPMFGAQSSTSNTSSTVTSSDGGPPSIDQPTAQQPSPAKQRRTQTPKGKAVPTETPPRINLDDIDFESPGETNTEQQPKHNGTKDGGGGGSDPFDFTTQSSIHPEPFKNISIERASFNEVKFTKSLPSSADRYANMEKIAASRNPQLAASLSSSNSQDRDRSAMSLSQLSALTNSSLRLELSQTTASGGGTPKSITSAAAASQRGTPSSAGRKRGGGTAGRTPRGRASAAKRRSAAEEEDGGEQESEPEEEEEEKMELDESQGSAKNRTRNASSGGGAIVLKTPQSNARKLEAAAKATAEKKRKEAEAELYSVPELSAEEQLDVDWPKEGHLFLPPGARVLALWGSDYYAANICGRDGLSRYYVHFVEDDLNRVLPYTGVIPISALRPGTKLSFIDVVNGDEMGKASEVAEQPATDAPDAWVSGEFQLRELDEEGQMAEESKMVSWKKLYMSKEQAHHLLQQQQKPAAAAAAISSPRVRGTARSITNAVQRVDEENIIAESRSTRRSRGAALARLSSASTGAAAAAGGTPNATATAADDNISKDATATPTSPRTATPLLKGEGGSSTGRRSTRGRQSVASVKEEGTPKEKAAETKETKEQKAEEAVEKTEQNESVASTRRRRSSASTVAALKSPQQQATTPATGSRRSPRGAKQLAETTPSASAVAEQKKQQQKQSTKSEEEEATNIFAGLMFVLTSATRPNKKVTDFNKREYRKKIEERGGQIIEDFSSLTNGGTAYLIADTHYRTHKYLTALSLSIPCISFVWIQQCVAENKLTDFNPHLLPAGESSLDPDQLFKWKPLKDVLMKGKRVLIYSTVTNVDAGALSFGEIWTPILRNLGATLVGAGDGEPFSINSKSTLEEKMAFVDQVEPPLDVLLTEADCAPELAQRAQARGSLAVSSEWVIQAIVTGDLPTLDVEGGERFRYDFA